MTEKLIELVRKHPCLYDTKNNSYKNIIIKAKLWEQIGEEINETGEQARKKWKNLRDNYMRYKKEVAGTTGQAAKKFSKWPWAFLLQFLDSILTDRERSSNVRQSTPETSSDTETPSPQIPQSDTPPPQTPPTQTPPPQTPPPEAPPAYSINRTRNKKIKKNDSEMDKVINFIQNKKKEEHDAIDHLFKSYAQTFKTFSKDKQIKAKVELAKLFASIETEELQENVQLLNNSPHYSIVTTENSVSYDLTNSGPEDLSPVAVRTSSAQQQPEQLEVIAPVAVIDLSSYIGTSSYQQQPEQQNFRASTSSVDFHNDNAINMYFKK